MCFLANVDIYHKSMTLGGSTKHFTTRGLPDAFCKNTGHFDLSTVPDLSCVVFLMWHRDNRDTIIIVKSQLMFCLYFGWLITFWCVRDAKIAPRIWSTAANKLC